MAKAYTPANGTLLQMDIASVQTTVAQRVSVEPPELTREEIETTDLDSTDKTSIPSAIARAGDVKLKCWYNPADATHTALFTAYDNKTVGDYTIVYADANAGEDAFTGWIKSIKKGTAEIDGLVSLEITFAVTGGVTFTSNAST